MVSADSRLRSLSNLINLKPMFKNYNCTEKHFTVLPMFNILFMISFQNDLTPFKINSRGETVTEDLPLVIPMKPNTLITAEKLKQIAEKVESAIQEPEIKEEPVIKEERIEENETLEQMAVRELMQEARKDVKVEVSDNLAIPTPAKPVMTGEKEVHMLTICQFFNLKD